jgi:hypothetical protein
MGPLLVYAATGETKPIIIPLLGMLMDETQKAVDLADTKKGRLVMYNDEERNNRFSLQLTDWFDAQRSRFETFSMLLKCYHPIRNETFSHYDECNDSTLGYHCTVAFCFVVSDKSNNLWSFKVSSHLLSMWKLHHQVS